MWRAVKETNRLTGQSLWVIEKQTKFLWRASGWTRNYSVGETIFNSPIKAFTSESALRKIAILETGKIYVQTEAVCNE
tara:strand:+ start:152 stop:385 length:234 start_codon:yes stop_codon:yes gene_type:complete